MRSQDHVDAVIRPASRSDKVPLMAFIKDVWGGHDYIPRVWDRWLRDRKNKMYVVTVGGVPVGMNRIRFMEDGSAWFEGVRIHPGYRGRGLASMLGENSMKVAKGSGVFIFRLTSGSRNHAAHRQIARIRFKETARFSIYEPAKVHLRRGGAERIGRREAPIAFSLIRESAEYRLGHGVFWHNFAAANLSRKVVEKLVREGAVWRRGRAVAVVRKGGEGGEAWQQVCFVGGPPTDAVKLVQAVLGWGKAAERWAFVPQGSPVIRALRAAGFRRTLSNILFERNAAKG